MKQIKISDMIQPSNNIFIGGQDPLLSSNVNYNNIDSQIGEINRLKAIIGQKEQYLEQMKSQITQGDSQQAKSRTPVWDEIDSIIQSLNDKEYELVSNNEEFIESSNNIAAILQSAYMEMMRPIVEGSQKGKDALDNHLTLVKRLKKSASSEVKKEISDFQEYTEKYSDIPYSEYLKMKKQSKGSKK